MNDLPLLDGVTLSEEQVGQIYPAGVDIVGPSGSMSSRAGLMSLRREYRQPDEKVLTESLPVFGADAGVQDDDELMGKDSNNTPNGCSAGPPLRVQRIHHHSPRPVRHRP